MGERESEVRRMEVGGYSTLHCTHGDDEGRESRRGGGGGDEKQDSTTASRLHDTEALQSTTKVRPRVEMATWVMAGRWPVALLSQANPNSSQRTLTGSILHPRPLPLLLLPLPCARLDGTGEH